MRIDNRQPDFDWSDEAIQRLRTLWYAGVSMAQIGAQLGTSKNSVVGKVGRLGLTPRPSPIKPSTGAPKRPNAARKPPRTGKSTLAPLSSITAAQAPIVAAVKIAPEPAVIFRAPKSRNPCAWPTGESPRIRFVCEENALLGKPYCATHCRAAFSQRAVAGEGMAKAGDYALGGKAW